MRGDGRRAGSGGAGRLRRGAAGVCLLAPVVALLWVPGYAREEPRLAGVPFFYWYQLAWVPLCALGLLAAYLLTRRAAGPGPPPAPDP
ncbi:hypothetical protein GCM10010232_39330 [Streptomyces amakusaensis]|uniref:DUF3311 domain-containing protein n=1 Tax=Streptomyces amakusaensis TaxID=67271 RepID=A0ABW0AN68_9ACTN